MTLVDEFPQHMAGPKHENPAGQDRHLLTGLGIAADPLALLTNGEATERRYFDAFPTRQGITNFIEHCLDQGSRFFARESNLLGDGRTSGGTRFCLSRQCIRVIMSEGEVGAVRGLVTNTCAESKN